MIHFKLDDKAVADNTLLLFGIRYAGSTSGKTYTFAALKAGGRWFLTGTGKTPQDASWAAVERWLNDRGRVVAWVKVAQHLEPLWTNEAVDEQVAEAREYEL